MEGDRPTRRRLLAAAAGVLAAGAAAACGPAPPGRARLGVAGELVAPGVFQAPYQSDQPGVALRFLPWPPGAGASALAMDPARFAAPALRRALVALDAPLSLIAFQPVGLAAKAWSAFSAGGAQLGVALAQSRLAVLYDGSALARPGSGWSLADLLAALDAVRSAGRQPLADLGGMRVDLWAGLVAARGGSLGEAEASLPQAASAEMAAAWQDVAALGAFSASGAAFGARAAAVALRFFLRPADVTAAQAGGLAVGVARFPGAAVPARAWGHGLPAAAPEPGAALEFLAWTAEPVCQHLLWRAGYIPVLEAFAASPPPLPAAAGADAGALVPNAVEDAFLPPALRASAGAQAAFEAALAGAQPGLSAAAAAAAYAQAAALANAALAAT